MWRADSLEKTLILVKIESRKRREQERMRWFDRIIDSMVMCLCRLQETVKDREAWRAACNPWGRKELDTTWQLNNNNIGTYQCGYVSKCYWENFPGGPVVRNPPAADTGSIPEPGSFYIPLGNKARAPQLLKPTHPRASAPRRERPWQWAASTLQPGKAKT